MVCDEDVVTMADVTIEKIVYDLEAKVDKAIAGFEKVEKSVDKVDKKMDIASKSMEKGAKLVAKGWTLVAAAATAAVTALAASTVKSAANMESYMITLQNLYGDLDTAGRKMDWLLDFAKSTPFELPGLIDAMTKLKSYGIEGDTVMRTLGDTASALGKPLDMAVEALADAQTGEFERMKEFGVKAVKIIDENYEAIGATQADVGMTALTYVDAQQKQAIKVIDRNSREMITTAITGIFDERYMGGMEAQSKSMKGIWSNIDDAFYQGKIAFMGFDEETKDFREGSLFDRMKSGVQTLLDTVENINFEKAGKGIERFLTWMDKIGEYVKPWIELEKRINKAILGIVKDIGEGLGTKIEGNLDGLKLLLKDLYTAFLFLKAGVVALFEFAEAHDLGKYLAIPFRATAEAASMTYEIIRDKLIKALDFMIEKYNALVPTLKKAGFNVEVVSTDMFKPLEKSATDARGTVEEEMEAIVEEQRAAIDEMSRTAEGAEIIPGARASYAKIMGVDAAAAAGLSGVYGSQGIPAAKVPASKMPAAQPLSQMVTGPVQTSQQAQTSKYAEILKQMITSTNDVIQTLKEEPRKVDIDMDVDMKIETNQDVKKLEQTLHRAVSDGVRGKAQVV